MISSSFWMLKVFLDTLKEQLTENWPTERRKIENNNNNNNKKPVEPTKNTNKKRELIQQIRRKNLKCKVRPLHTHLRESVHKPCCYWL